MSTAFNVCLNLRNAGFIHKKNLLYMLNIRSLSKSQIFKAVPVLNNQCRFYAKDVYVRDKPHCNIGTIGHVDHGKTTLSAAITKVLSQRKMAVFKKFEEIDNAPEEKSRGITIHYSSFSYATDKRHYGHVDCPGHADYIKNMIVGTCQMDGAIVVVAGTDGVMPQTREHLLLSRQIGLKNVVVFINKADAADSDMLELVEMEVRELLAEMGFDGDNTPVVCGSALFALQGKDDELGEKSILKLLDAVDNYIPTPERELDKPFMMPIETVFSVKGRGTVASGRLERGQISKGQELEILGYNNKVKGVATSLEMFQKTLDVAVAGDKCGILVRGLKKDDIKRGMFVTKPNSMSLCDNLECQVYLLSKEEGGRAHPVTSYMNADVYSNCWVVSASLLTPGKEMVMPGEDATFEIKLWKKMAVEEGQRFTVRHLGQTIGTGVVAKINPNMDTHQLEDLKLGKRKRELKKLKPKKK